MRLSGPPVIQDFLLSHETGVGAQLTYRYLMQKASCRSSTGPTKTQVNIHKNIIGNGNVIGMVGNVSNSKVLLSLKKRDQEGRAENIDDGEADPNYNEDDYSNCDIDPNIELSGTDTGPKSLKDWDYLNSSVDYPHYDLSTEIKDLFIVLLDTNSLNKYKKCLYNVTFYRENDIEMIFVIDVLLWYAKNVFNTTSAFHSINKNEALLGSLMIHPVLQYLVNATKHVIYVPGEIYLKASADEPLGMKVDGSFQFPDERGLEIGMVELSGGYLTKDRDVNIFKF
ncbi:14913_t:CDS:2 [Dentiscutata erythropus]|uniref:14913_t:CDS:1 n=1 Tax=Dentiscutata erythropus TaxID=1348616 RepID=A0A9N9BIC8_9GLOM|nr:14913_t:CDS:2 [Dentiscutata erythropus]